MNFERLESNCSVKFSPHIERLLQIQHNITISDDCDESENQVHGTDSIYYDDLVPLIFESQVSGRFNGSTPLFPDSNFTLLDFSLAVLNLRQQFPKSVGDQMTSAFVGLSASFIGRGNPIENYLAQSNSYYSANQLILSIVSKYQQPYPCRMIQYCEDGCTIFSGPLRNLRSCPICHKEKSASMVYYYLPFKDRLESLLNSKMYQKLFNYEKLRDRKPNKITDIYDGSNWKHFESLLHSDERLIGLEICWDGTTPFQYSSANNESLWPILCSILNFPSTLRGKIHIGLHMLGVNYGAYSIWDSIVEEFNDLWINGIIVGDIKYRIAIIRVTLDGKGLQTLTKTSGSVSYSGCNKCHFPGLRFANRQCYPYHRRYLDSNDRRRMKTCHEELQLDPSLQYHFEVVEPEPTPRTYQEYLANGHRAEQTHSTVDGVKGVWTLQQLPYAANIYWIKDPMHSFANIIKDCVKVLRPTNSDFSNRTESSAVRIACEQANIFKHLHQRTTPNMKARWAFTSREVREVHEQMTLFHEIGDGLKKPFKTNGGSTSHDKLVWATTYAHYVLSGKGNHTVTSNILTIFDLINILRGYEYDLEGIRQLLGIVYCVLATHEGILPPSEATYTMHELVHIVQQIEDLGPPLMSSLFKYERQNKFLKDLIKNKSYPIGSLIKNYLISEMASFSVGQSIATMKRVQDIFSFTDTSMRDNATKFLHGLKNLRHENGVLYCYEEADEMEGEQERMWDLLNFLIN
jgi:hypothetical protein